MPNDAIKFCHIRQNEAVYHCGKLSFTPTPRGGVTVAYTITAAAGEAGFEIFFAVAECSDKDNYCRATGRAIATGRLASNKHCHSFHVDSVEDGAALTGAVIDNALGTLPRWTGVKDDEEIMDDLLLGAGFTYAGITPNGNPA